LRAEGKSVLCWNEDVMPHNLVIASPGKLEEIAVAADKMQTDPAALERNYVPDSPLVLHATKLLQAGEKDKLFFEAPAAGDYPYLCTFPGHSRRMNGILRVVPDLDAVPPEELNPSSQQIEVRPFVQAWTVADFQNDVRTMSGGRSFEKARTLFQAAACVTCHKVQGTGGVIGPDLTDLAKTKKYTANDVLHEVIEPSHRIDDKFRPQIFQMDDGRVITGVVVQEDDTKLLVVTNPLVECEPAVVVKEEIDEKFPAQISIMPTGLLNTLTREEALDLIAYVVAGGNPGHEFFK
jgi:putative heme-binding domain-containing protein